MGEKYGIPVLGVTAVGKDMVRDARYFSLQLQKGRRLLRNVPEISQNQK